MPRHWTFVPPASRRRLCLHPPRSNKTHKTPNKKLSTTKSNHFSTQSSTALQAQNLQPIAPTLSPGKPRRPRQTRKAKTTHHRKTSRELPRHFPPPTQAPQIDRPRQVPQVPRRRPAIRRRNSRRRSRPPLQLRPRL